MKVTEATFKQVLGLEEKQIRCGSITTVSGKNGSGKSSILRALQNVLGGGSLATLARVDAPEDEGPEAVIVLNDGEYRVEKNAKSVKVKQRIPGSSAYEAVKKPQEFLAGLFNMTLANPVQFIFAKPQDRVTMLLEAVDLKVDLPALREAVGELAASTVPNDVKLGSMKPLDVLEAVHDAIYEARRGFNVSSADKEKSAYELNKLIPPEIEAAPGPEALSEANRLVGEAQTREAELRSTMLVEHESKVAAAKARHEQASETISGGFKTVAAKVRAKLERDIAVLRQNAEAEIEHARADAEGLGDAQDEMLATELGHLEALLAAKRVDVDAAVEALNARKRSQSEIQNAIAAASKLQATVELRDKFVRERDEIEGKAQELSDALKRLEQFRRKLVAGVPIEGLKVTKSDILVNDVSFDDLNRAQQVTIAMKLALLHNTGVVFVDDAEHLDDESLKLLEELILDAGAQAFIARVTNAPKLELEARS